MKGSMGESTAVLMPSRDLFDSNHVDHDDGDDSKDCSLTFFHACNSDQSSDSGKSRGHQSASTCLLMMMMMMVVMIMMMMLLMMMMVMWLWCCAVLQRNAVGCFARYSMLCSASRDIPAPTSLPPLSVERRVAISASKHEI
jgi:hypothetical protein